MLEKYLDNIHETLLLIGRHLLCKYERNNNFWKASRVFLLFADRGPDPFWKEAEFCKILDYSQNAWLYLWDTDLGYL